MRTARKLGLCLASLAFPAIFGGCHRAPSPLTPVSGKVAYQGSPLVGGTIVFTPDSARGESGPIAFGRINQDGTYHLYTGDALGAQATGKFRVTVTSLVPSAFPAEHRPNRSARRIRSCPRNTATPIFPIWRAKSSPTEPTQ